MKNPLNRRYSLLSNWSNQSKQEIKNIGISLEQLAFLYSLLYELVPKIRDPITVIINYNSLNCDNVEILRKLLRENSGKLAPKVTEDIDRLLIQLLENYARSDKQTDKILKIVDAITYQVLSFKAMSEYESLKVINEDEMRDDY